MDPLLLSRIQFAANISFHILFPAITIALGWVLLYFRVRWLGTRDAVWKDAYLMWTKVFALSFAIGVVTGITMSFQFGTNWPGFMERVGNIAGPLLGYEVLTAFFLEAGFLGIMLFGHDRVSERTHLVATALVAIGTTLSAFWILSLNSWMQTPTGYRIIGGEFHVESWMAVIFNPSFPYRLAHMLIASALTVAFLMAGFSAWQFLRGTADAASGRVLAFALRLAAVLVPVQVLVGDLHGLNTLEHQPQKIAAMEAIWETERGAPLLLFAVPNERTRSNDYAIGIPRLGSLILRHDPDGEIRGLNEFVGAHPPVAPVFYAFRVMVGVGVLMGLVSWTLLWLARRGGGVERLSRRALWVLVPMGFSGWVAVLAGWYVTEIGRQPFLVFGLLRTAEAGPRIGAGEVATTLVAYLLLYLFLGLAYVGVLKHLAEKKRAPVTAVSPSEGEPAVVPIEEGRT